MLLNLYHIVKYIHSFKHSDSLSNLFFFKCNYFNISQLSIRFKHIHKFLNKIRNQLN